MRTILSFLPFFECVDGWIAYMLWSSDKRKMKFLLLLIKTMDILGILNGQKFADFRFSYFSTGEIFQGKEKVKLGKEKKNPGRRKKQSWSLGRKFKKKNGWKDNR